MPSHRLVTLSLVLSSLACAAAPAADPPAREPIAAVAELPIGPVAEAPDEPVEPAPSLASSAILEFDTPRADALEIEEAVIDSPFIRAQVDVERYDMGGPSITKIPLGAPQETIVAALAEVEGIRELNLGGTQMVDLQHIARLDPVEVPILRDAYVVDLPPLPGCDGPRPPA